MLECGDFEQKVAQKKEENTADILAYMERQRGKVCEVIGVSLEVLPGKIRAAKTAPEVTTALGTVIDKWTMISSSPDDIAKEDDLSRSLRELGQELESDE